MAQPLRADFEIRQPKRGRAVLAGEGFVDAFARQTDDAWIVLPDLQVVSFANYRHDREVNLRHAEAARARAGRSGKSSSAQNSTGLFGSSFRRISATRFRL